MLDMSMQYFAHYLTIISKQPCQTAELIYKFLMLTAGMATFHIFLLEHSDFCFSQLLCMLINEKCILVYSSKKGRQFKSI